MNDTLKRCSGTIEVMSKVFLFVVLGAVLAACLVSSADDSSYLQDHQQALQEHQQALLESYSRATASNSGSLGGRSGSYDNHNKENRDRGYGFEKMYAYSRDTAVFDFIDDKGALNSRDLVEKQGGRDDKEDALIKNFAL